MADERPAPGLLWRAFATLGGFWVVLAVALFVPAGDIRWANAWLFLAVFALLMALAIVYLWHTNPDIFVARSRIHPGTEKWDRMLLPFVLLSFVAIFPVAGLDAGRFHAWRVPLWLVVLGYVLWCAGFVLSIWVYRVNKFAEPGVRLQRERGQTVIDTGPYALVRHPLYLGALVMCAGIPLSLGSYWALLPSAFGAVILVMRTTLEDRFLREGLAGYRQYAARVRYRLIPGLW
jgi:protein-S-isoprenylcysteine O-methyltransferase Ste14